MNSLLLKNCLLSLLLIGLALPCGAKEPQQTVSFDYQCIALSKDFRGVSVYLSTGEKSPRERVRLGDLSKSSVLHYKGPPLMLFYDQPTGGQLLARLQFEPSMKSPLFIFSHPPKKSKMKYSVFQIENDWSVYGPNSYVLINLSSKVLYWMVGEQRFKLEARSRHAVSVDGGDEKTQVVVLESNEDDKVSRVYRAKWRNRNAMRRLIFIRDVGANELGSVKLQVVEDYAPTKKS